MSNMSRKYLLGFVFFVFFFSTASCAHAKSRDGQHVINPAAVKALQKQIDSGYRELIRLNKKHEYRVYLQRSQELSELLANPSLPRNYRIAMRKKIGDLTQKTALKYKKDMVTPKPAAKAADTKQAAKSRKTQKKDAVPKAVTRSAGEDISALRQEREAEDRRIRQRIYEDNPVLKNDSSDLGRKVIERKEQIIRERDFIDQELAQEVGRLYNRAVKSYQYGAYGQSRRDFSEIEKLYPNYKDTLRYLKDLEGKDPQTRPSLTVPENKPAHNAVNDALDRFEIQDIRK